MNDKVIYIATKYEKNGKIYKGISKVIVRREIGVKKSMENFFTAYGITKYEYKAFSRKWEAMRYKI
jgi:hypothetical protein